MEWKNILKDKPKTEGMYYVFLSNIMSGEWDIVKCEYKNMQWSNNFDKNTKIIAWKPISSNTAKYTLAWMKEHENEIKKAFTLDYVQYECFEVAESFLECLVDYEWWIWHDFIRYIDGAYVIKILY